MAKIFTIGYGNRKIDTFSNLLIEYDIRILVDVRSNPFTRFDQNFNKNQLAFILKSIGIEYLYRGDVMGGKPTNPIFYTNTKLDYFLINDSESYKAALKELVEFSAINNTCLMCCELNPNNCHRKNLIGETLAGRGI